MPLDTVTLVLSGDGDIPVKVFAAALQNFAALIGALSEEAGRPDLEWVVDDLARGSNLATARGVGDLAIIERVVRAYGEVGVSLQEQEPVHHTPRVRVTAGRLRAIVGGRIESMRMETAEREAIIRPRRPKKGTADVIPLPAPVPVSAPMAVHYIRPAPAAFGAIQGRVQTLTNRGRLRFTIFDALDDKAVSCYLVEGGDEMMRDAWGKLATVEGWITRDPLSGRPLSNIAGVSIF